MIYGAADLIEIRSPYKANIWNVYVLNRLSEFDVMSAFSRTLETLNTEHGLYKAS